jgi:hypothetical protein
MIAFMPIHGANFHGHIRPSARITGSDRIDIGENVVPEDVRSLLSSTNELDTILSNQVCAVLTIFDFQTWRWTVNPSILTKVLRLRTRQGRKTWLICSQKSFGKRSDCRQSLKRQNLRDEGDML